MRNLLVVKFSLILNLKCQWWRWWWYCHEIEDSPKQVSWTFITEEDEGSDTKEHDHHLSYEHTIGSRSSLGDTGKELFWLMYVSGYFFQIWMP